jgi:LacI family transcriptional regulator
MLTIPDMKPLQPSIRTLAAATGYSVATVSMALRGLGRIPPSTRQKIEQLAAANGYLRDPEMARLMSRARRTSPKTDREVLMFLAEVPIGAKPDPRSPWLHPMFHRARDAARLLGCELEHVTVEQDPRSHEKLSRSLRARGIRGLLVGPVTTWRPAELRLNWEFFAAVELGTTLQQPLLHRVERGFYDDLRAAYDHLRTCGYRRIGLAMTKTRLEFMRHMPEATLLYFQQEHPEMIPIPPLTAAHEWSQAGLRDWLREQKPDVLVVYDEEVWRWLPRLKIRVPQDIGVFYLSSNGGSQSGLVPDVNLLTREAIHLLNRLVERAEWGLPHHARSHRFNNFFHPGATLRRKSRKPASHG